MPPPPLPSQGHFQQAHFSGSNSVGPSASQPHMWQPPLPGPPARPNPPGPPPVPTAGSGPGIPGQVQPLHNSAQTPAAWGSGSGGFHATPVAWQTPHSTSNNAAASEAPHVRPSVSQPGAIQNMPQPSVASLGPPAPAVGAIQGQAPTDRARPSDPRLRHPYASGGAAGAQQPLAGVGSAGGPSRPLLPTGAQPGRGQSVQANPGQPNAVRNWQAFGVAPHAQGASGPGNAAERVYKAGGPQPGRGRLGPGARGVVGGRFGTPAGRSSAALPSGPQRTAAPDASFAGLPAQQAGGRPAPAGQGGPQLEPVRSAAPPRGFYCWEAGLPPSFALLP
jgi:hypothetical protein